MNCSDAAPFVPALYDSADVPAEAVRHIAGCDACRTWLRDIGGAGAELKLVAAVEALDWRDADDRVTSPAPPPVAAAAVGVPVVSRVWSGVVGGVRVPRLVIGAAAALLVVGGFAWLRPHAAPTSNRWFTYRIELHCPGVDLPVDVTSGSTMIGSTSTAFSSASCPGDTRGLATSMEVRSANKTQVTLGLRLERTPAGKTPQAAMRDVAGVALRNLVYTSGETSQIPLDNATVVLTGDVETREDLTPVHEALTAMLPGANEMQINAPALIRDGKDLVAVFNAGASCRANESAILLYAPGEGLFLLALGPPPAAGAWSPALAGGSMLTFTAGGHKYTIYAALPITGGDQPKTVFVRYLPNYRPSQHGQDPSADALTMLGSGNPGEYR